MVEIWLPERGAIALLDTNGRQTLWIRSCLKGVWRPNEYYLDPAWKLVGDKNSSRVGNRAYSDN